MLIQLFQDRLQRLECYSGMGIRLFDTRCHAAHPCRRLDLLIRGLLLLLNLFPNRPELRRQLLRVAFTTSRLPRRTLRVGKQLCPLRLQLVKRAPVFAGKGLSMLADDPELMQPEDAFQDLGAFGSPCLQQRLETSLREDHRRGKAIPVKPDEAEDLSSDRLLTIEQV